MEHTTHFPANTVVGSVPSKMTPVVCLHLVSGATIIGIYTPNTADHNRDMDLLPLADPYEVLCIPNPDSQKPQITLIRFGSMYEIMPSLAFSFVHFRRSTFFGVPLAVKDAGLLEAYENARRQNAERQATPGT